MYHKNNNQRINTHKKDQISKICMDELNELTKPDGSYANYIFDCKNLRQFTKHNIDFSQGSQNFSQSFVSLSGNNPIQENKKYIKDKTVSVFPKELKSEIYKPKQKDSLFWCFYILKHGFSKYEMEVGNQHFQIEKQEKFKYIDQIRKTCNKDLLKMHKIKPLTLIEDDLANQERISVKTFFALCIIENINIILIDKRKIYEVLTTDDPKINIIHRNSITYEHHIEVNVLLETINMYKETYYKMSTFDVSLKSIASYKVEELLEMCKKLDIKITNDNTKKKSKKDIYELLVQNF
jgi:hypothetical protein